LQRGTRTVIFRDVRAATPIMRNRIDEVQTKLTKRAGWDVNSDRDAVRLGAVC
jgi:hypothetical protein